MVDIECFRTKNIYVLLVPIEEGKRRKTSVFEVMSSHSNDELAMIRWHGPWRQYTLQPFENIIWSDGCLTDVAKFLGMLREARRKARAGEASS